jgi:hypothetical protein
VGIVEEQHDDHHWRRADHHHHCYSAGHGPRRVRAWVFCADRPGLLSDIGRTVRSASARPVRAEIATAGGLTRSVLELDVCDGDRAVALSTLRAVEEGCKRPRFSAQIVKDPDADERARVQPVVLRGRLPRSRSDCEGKTVHRTQYCCFDGFSAYIVDDPVLRTSIAIDAQQAGWRRQLATYCVFVFNRC